MICGYAEYLRHISSMVGIPIRRNEAEGAVELVIVGCNLSKDAVMHHTIRDVVHGPPGKDRSVDTVDVILGCE